MTLRDLTDDQIRQVQTECAKARKAWLDRRKQAHKDGTPTQDEIWSQAFSDGAKAALAAIPNPT